VPCTHVHVTKHYSSVASLRADLAGALDHAERGEVVEVERRGRVFVLRAAAVPARREASTPFFELLDQGLLEDGWSWELQNGSLELRPAARRVAKRPAPSRRSKRRK
jgi:hypothetical protein